MSKAKRCVLTETPAPRSPSLGSGSLSIIRTGTPFFGRDRARTRPDGPAPTYKGYRLNRFSRILLRMLTMSTGCMCTIVSRPVDLGYLDYFSGDSSFDVLAAEHSGDACHRFKSKN